MCCWRGGGPGEGSGISFRGAPCIGEGTGDSLGPKRVQGSPLKLLGIEEHLDPMTNVNKKEKKRHYISF